MIRSPDPNLDAMRRTKIVSVLTCFNRKAMTLSCLGALQAAARRAHVELETIVVDDASTDGTAAAIRTEYSWVEIMDGSGALFWESWHVRRLRSGAGATRRLKEYATTNPNALSRPDQSRAGERMHL
jgi:hypothetical protein